MPVSLSQLAEEAIVLLRQLIETPSFSREEAATADLLAQFLTQHGIPVRRQGHNVWAVSEGFDSQKPTILLNSHHDTVKPEASDALANQGP